MSAHDRFRILSFAGSIRMGSYNRALLRAAEELAPKEMIFQHFDISSIPLYNTDEESKQDPEPVKVFKEAIRDSNALLIATPEYNYGTSGVLKNAIDWASRPPGKSFLAGKPAAIMGASMGMGGTIRAQLSLRQTFLFTETYVLLKPEVLVAHAHEKFDSDGKLIHDHTRQQLVKFLAAFLEWIPRFPSRA